MNNKKSKDYFFVGTVIFLCLVLIGVSYAYFKLQIEGTGKDIVMDTGDLRLRYTDGAEITLNNAFPGDTVTKKVTVENIGTKEVNYSLYWSDLINTITNDELTLTMDCKSYTGYGTTSQTENGTCKSITKTIPMSEVSTSEFIKKNLPIAVGVTHEYTITVTFDDKEYEQNYNKKKNFSGKVDVREYSSPAHVYCTYDGTPGYGTTYSKGIYTYTYNSDWNNGSYNYYWSVALTDATSTDPISEAPCTYINDLAVTSMNKMFYESKATSIDVSLFNTENITDMSRMFEYSKATEIKGLEELNTSNVTNMSFMFQSSKVEKINLENFDTSNVTNMWGMFSSSNVNSLDISNFNTSKVTNMYGMFSYSKITNVMGLDIIDTSNVTDMGAMFYNSQLTSVNVSNFDTRKVTDMSYLFSSKYLTEIIGLEKLITSKVTDMRYMFEDSILPKLDLTTFDTSNVTRMTGMFEMCKTVVIDVSSFDTSKVTDMDYMFAVGYNLTTIYASDKFVTTKASAPYMFSGSRSLVGGAGTVFSDYLGTDKTFARIDGGPDSDTPGYFTLKSN